MPKRQLTKDRKKYPIRLTPQEDRQMKLLARWFQDRRTTWRKFVGEERAARLGINLDAEPSRQALWIIGLDHVAAEVKAFRMPRG